MRRLFVLGFVFVSLLSSATASAAPEWMSLGDDAFRADSPLLVEAGENAGEVALEARFDGLWVETVDTELGSFVEATLPGGASRGLAGSPSLPVLRRRVAVPYGGDVKLLVHRSDPVEVPLSASLVPAQPGQRKCGPAVPFAYDAKAYRRVAGAESGARVYAEQIWRGVRHAIVEISPTQYDPETETLTLYRQVSVLVRTASPDLARTRRVLSRTLPGLAREVSGQMAGLDLLLPFKDPIPPLPVHYVLVVADHAGQGFLTPLAPLVAWKEEKGFVVTVLQTSVVGTLKEDIKAALRDLYENPDPSTGAPAYAVLVGDVQHIPYWVGTGDDDEQAADQYYATMDAPDSNYTADQVPDFHVGRFSVADADELEVVVAKTLAHEQPVDPEAEWYQRSLWVASDDMDAMGRVTHQWVAPAFTAEGMEITNAFKDIVGEAQAEATAKAAIAEGQSIVNYSGHGYHQGWACVPVDNDWVEDLDDSGAYPFVITNACQSGQFQYNGEGDCFSEAWLKSPGGAVASWAASNSSLWDEDDLIEKAVWAAFLPSLRDRTDDANMANYPWEADEAYTTVGGITDMGLQLFYERAPESWSVQYAIEEYNVLGDPSVDLWSRQPMTTTVSLPGAVLIGQPEVAVTVTTADGPVANALVAVHKDGELDLASYTDVAGQASLPIDVSLSPGDLRVVVTGHNLLPYQGSVTVIPPAGAYVSLAERVWFDDGSEGTRGNGDGLPSPGERLGLHATFQNFGTDTASAAQATLSSSDPCVTVVRGGFSIGDLTAGGEAATVQPFLVDVGACANNHGVLLSMTIVSGSDSWVQELPLTVTSAVSGQVTVEASGAALAGVTLLWDGPESGRLAVGDDGRFVIRGLDDGTYTLVARHDEYLDEETTFTVPAAAALDIRMGRPEGGVNPATLELSVSPTAPTARGELRVVNIGDRALSYAAASGYGNGDDAFGYRWSDSDEGDVVSGWVDVPQADRHILSLGDDDDTSVSLSFDFPFYGVDQSRLNVGSNGYVNFGASDPGVPWDVSSLPSYDLPQGLLAVHYQDLNPEDGGQIYWGLVGGSLVVTWDDVPEYTYEGGGTPYTFQAVLSPTGEIRYNYQSSASSEAIVGLQDIARTRGMNVGSTLHDGLSVAVSTSVAWVSLTNGEGVVAGGSGVTMGVYVDATGLGIGDYTTTLRVASNDIDDPVFPVEVMMHVTENVDRDGDGIDDNDDNCPDVSNPGQEDENGNDVGDACEFPCDTTDCDDGNVCTADSCDSLDGCQYEPRDGRCSDGDICTTDDTCVDGSCQGRVLACDDGNACTIDSCDATLGCVHEVSNGACDDGDPCTTGDSCATGECVGVPMDCDDDDVCTNDSCDDGVCVYLNNTAACDDGDPCTVSDACASGVCSGVPLDCDDGDPCTEMVCVDGSCELDYELPGCCTVDEDCKAPFERCDAEILNCLAVQCAECESDEDCGSDNLCLELESGSFCLVSCGVGTTCPEGSSCHELSEDGAAACLPEEGDCVCGEHGEQVCSNGDLYWFDTCGQREDLAEDCEGRGCVDEACCLTGWHAEQGECVEDEQPVEPTPDAGSTDVGGVDAGAMDAGAPDVVVPVEDVATEEDTWEQPEEDVIIRIDAYEPGADAGGDGEGKGSGGCSHGASGAGAAPFGLLLLAFGLLVARRWRVLARSSA